MTQQQPYRWRRWALTFAGLALLASLWNTCQTAAQDANQANYDEAKVGSFTLPDPLVFSNGKRVTNARAWRQRRAEILRLFETQVYGRTPPTKTGITFTETKRSENAVNGLAVRREVTVNLLGKPDGPQLRLLIYTPKTARNPVPVFLSLNFNGNHSVEPDPGISLPTGWVGTSRDNSVVNNRATEAGRGNAASRWPLELILTRGYGLVTFYAGDLFPDHAKGLADSFIPHLYRAGQTAPAPDEWNALGAWAWGLSRAFDVIERDKLLDARRVAVIGHSRMGKATLWAGAQDERFALVISNNSGEGGAALTRRNFGETHLRINTSFPHWFNQNYKQYSGKLDTLPVDQHMLLALIAPRPLYVASAAEDLWADPRGEFLSAKAADPVYRLLGTEGLGATEMPGVNQPVLTTIGYHIRTGKHDVTKYDWEQYLNFADRHLRRR
jgi:hypothetical protein